MITVDTLNTKKSELNTTRSGYVTQLATINRQIDALDGAIQIIDEFIASENTSTTSETSA
jgi:hypothetical protein